MATSRPGPGFNIQGFRSALQLGGARPNQFQVTLTFPQIVTGAVGSDVMSFMCKSASLPGEDIAPIIVPYFGRQIKLAGDRTFPEWTVNIINEADFAIRNSFELWSGLINSHVGNIRDPGALNVIDYQQDMLVTQYSMTGDPVKSYTMVGAWPSTVTPIEVSWDQNDTIEEFQVTFQYQWWESQGTTDTV